MTMKTVINLINGQNVQTTDNSAADVAGLVNAVKSGQSQQAIYQCTDLNAQSQHHIAVDAIVSIYETN